MYYKPWTLYVTLDRIVYLTYFFYDFFCRFTCSTVFERDIFNDSSESINQPGRYIPLSSTSQA